MAVHEFDSAGAGITVGTGATDIFVCGGSEQCTVHSVYISNLKTTTVTATLYMYDASATATATICLNAQIEASNTLVFDKPLNMAAGDKIQCSCGTSGDVGIFVSVLKIS